MQGQQRDTTQHAAADAATPTSDPIAPANTGECLDYLANMVAQLGRLAGQAGYDRLAVILELACDEAHTLVARQAASGPPGDITPAP